MASSSSSMIPLEVTRLILQRPNLTIVHDRAVQHIQSFTFLAARQNQHPRVSYEKTPQRKKQMRHNKRSTRLINRNPTPPPPVSPHISRWTSCPKADPAGSPIPQTPRRRVLCGAMQRKFFQMTPLECVARSDTSPRKPRRHLSFEDDLTCPGQLSPSQCSSNTRSVNSQLLDEALKIVNEIDDTRRVSKELLLS